MAYAPPNGPAGGKNAYQRSIIRIIRPINGSPVGRMQYAPTQEHKNAPRLGYTRASDPHFLGQIAHTSMIPPQNEGYA